jgi:hypothetical protein
MSPFSVLPRELLSSLLATLLSLEDRIKLRATCAELRIAVDSVTESVFLRGFRSTDADRLRVLVEHMNSLTGLDIMGPVTSGHLLGVLLRTLGENKSARLLHLSLDAGQYYETHKKETAAPLLLDLSPLAACTQLERFDMKTQWVSVDLTGLTAVTSLKHLALKWHHKLRDLAPDDLSPLSSCTQLEYLDLIFCSNVKYLYPLTSCPLLHHLHLHGCTSVVDISPLASCLHLTDLDLAYSYVKDLAPLASCTKLQ